MRVLLLILVRGYRWLLSPVQGFFLGPGPACRHLPTCSVYAEEAIRNHGACRGVWLTLCRLGRCHPWGTSGWDPVPGSPETDSPSKPPAVSARENPCTT